MIHARYHKKIFEFWITSTRNKQWCAGLIITAISFRKAWICRTVNIILKMFIILKN